MANVSKITGSLATAISKVEGAAISGLAKIIGATISLFSNTQSLSHGPANVTDRVDASSTASDFQLIQTDAWSISFWIKVGWGTSTGGSFHLFTSNEAGSTSAQSEMWRVFYNNGNNRLYFGWRSASNQRSNNFIYFHNPAASGAGAISGLGTSWPSDKWSSSNRGYTTSDGFTLITLTKGTTATATNSNWTAYWNSKSLGTPWYVSGNNSGTVAMDASVARQIAIGNNSWNGNGQQGNGSATLFDEVSLWDKELSQAEVAEIWGGTDAVGATDGVVSNLQTSSMAANLIGYWRFETNGTVSTVGSATLTLNGTSTTSTTVP